LIQLGLQVDLYLDNKAYIGI